jgi:hypothetical protein
MRLNTYGNAGNTTLLPDSERGIDAQVGSVKKGKATLDAVDPKMLQSEMLPLSASDPPSSRFPKRRGPSWVLFTVISVLCVLVSPVRRSNIFSPASHLDLSRAEPVVDALAGMGFTGNGRTNDVLWDKYSLIIKGQRVFIQ